VILEQQNLSSIFPLTTEAKKLGIFVGEWNIEGYFTFQGKSLKVKGVWMLSWAAAGWGVLNVGELELEGLGVYEEVDILGFDTNEKMYHIFSVTNTAATHDHKGNWLDEKTMLFSFEGLQEGKGYEEIIEIRKVSPTELAIMEKDELEGQTVSAMDITLRKQPIPKNIG
jgi:hypothetical protein